MLPDVNFRLIRPSGSPPARADAFEELGCLLIERVLEDWPDGTLFRRFGNPDGGREGRARLPDGTVWAWQVKYMFSFDDSAATKVENSFLRTLETEPTLSRYLVVLPIDLPAGDSPCRLSANTRWERKVEEWRRRAANAGMSVRFDFVGKHELTKALLKPLQYGLVRYWFDESCMDLDWFRQQLASTLSKAGPRYTPGTHVDVDAARVLDGVARTGRHSRVWSEGLAELRNARQKWKLRASCDAEESAAPPDGVDAALDKADAAVTTHISSLSGFECLTDPGSDLRDAQVSMQGLVDLLAEPSYSERAAAPRRVLGALRRLRELCGSVAAQAARTQELLVTGRAGVGKTHLLCEVAALRLREELPTVLILGEDFDRRALSNQIPELLSFDGSVDELAGTLDAAAEAADSVGLLMIDALNDSENAEQWVSELKVLQEVVARYKRVGLVVTCRTEFAPEVLGDTTMPSLTHRGFGQSTEAAVNRYADHYGIEPPTLPILHPEFSNPLYLKLACEALQALRGSPYRLGSLSGLTVVCDAFLNAVNHRLAARDRCDFDETTSLVQEATRRLACASLDRPITREAIKQVTEDLLPSRRWSRSLMKGLLSEGVLIQRPNGVDFAYQRLGDVARASLLAERPKTEISNWINELGSDRWRHRGTLGALAVILPERQGVELVQILTHVTRAEMRSFVDSLSLRAASTVSDSVLTILRDLLANGRLVSSVLRELVRLGCLPNHPLNAHWSHKFLKAQSLSERDSVWSQWLIGKSEEDGPVRRLIDWARSLGTSGITPEAAVRHQAGLLLGWFLTASDRRVRDQSTKALVSLLEPAPDVARELLEDFSGVNDPYVSERLVAVACGIGTRSTDPTTHRLLSDGVVAMFGQQWPVHLMTRDYARNVLQLAVSTGWDLPSTVPSLHPPYGADLPQPSQTTAEIEALCGSPDYSYSSIWRSLTGTFGDFGRYVLRPALGHFVVPNEQSFIDQSERAVFGRVLELGWRPELFKDTDSRKHWEPASGNFVERIGKKYQWIAFYELLGRLADHFPIGEASSPPKPYEYPEQIDWRDIDPTTLARKPRSQTDSPSTYWFSPAAATFDRLESAAYPTTTKGIPEPLDLISVRDDKDQPWLVLESHPTWTEPLPAETRALQQPELYVWMHIRSYLASSQHIEDVRGWASDKDWWGRWMPESEQIYNLLLATYPHAPALAYRSAEPGQRMENHQEPPCSLHPTAALYRGTGTSRDASDIDETVGFIPSPHLHETLGLYRADDFAWADQLGIVLIEDPSVRTGGPSTLLAHHQRTVAKLAEAEMTMLWTVLLEKRLHTHSSDEPSDIVQTVVASASYALDNGTITRVHAAANLHTVGTPIRPRLQWATQAEDSP